MRKILVILTMLILLISCGKKGSKDDPFKNYYEIGRASCRERV